MKAAALAALFLLPSVAFFPKFGAWFTASGLNDKDPMWGRPSRGDWAQTRQRLLAAYRRWWRRVWPPCLVLWLAAVAYLVTAHG